jgi:FKBP-type peptidyl-prolyl cis-trans isomerase FklB
MKATVKMILVGIVAIGIGFAASRLGGWKKPALKTQTDRASYSIGVQLAKGFRQQGADVNPHAIAQGMEDVLSSKKLRMDEGQIRESLSDFQNEMTQKENQKMAAEAEKNLQEGEAFLTKTKTSEGVVTLPSGLMYKIIKEGKGKKPKPSDTVVCQYRGTLINGTEFDSSYKRGEPASFPVSAVIPGWTEALQLMPVGSKWQLFLPSKLAYGERGAGRAIGPNATLIFEVELLSIK